MRKWISTALALFFVMSVSIPVFAAENTMKNFKVVRVYSDQFSDVPASNWAASSVKTCYEYDLMKGVSSTEFNPKGNMTVAEALVIADRIHGIYASGVCDLQNGKPWYQPYIDYAVKQGIIAPADFNDYTANVTRSQMAYILYNALPQSEFEEINRIREIPDVNDTVKTAYEITALYAAGVLTGSDSYGTFYPDRSITRAETSAIVARVVVTSLRKTFTLEEDISSSSQSDPQKNSAAELSAGEIYTKCSPAVVYVTVYDAYGNRLQSGSGFFIDSAGTLVTNYHVIQGGSSAKVTTIDNQTYDITGVFDYDILNDIALLKVNGDNFPVLTVSDDTVAAGDTVYAIGSPLGLSNTISSGIVSNASRIYNNVNYIQVTAPISSGSSGGALINAYGSVIGITSGALYSDSSVSQNLNLAVPITNLKNMHRTSVSPMSFIVSAQKAQITVSSDTVQLAQGESTVIYVSHTSQNAVSMISYTEDPAIASCRWGGWVTSDRAALVLTGHTPGTTMITLSFREGETSDAQAQIRVTVI